jgi:ZIP family zinc transporter
MLEAAFWGLVGASTLILGAAVALAAQVSGRSIALTMSFGAGAFVSVLAFNLDEHAYELAGGPATVVGFVAGAIAFFALDRVIDNGGGDGRKRSGARRGRSSDRASAIGMIADGVPESVLIALTIVESGDIGGAVVAAVFLSNLGEGLAGATGLRRAGRSPRFVLRTWTAVAVGAGISAALGYALFNGASDGVVGFGHAAMTGAALCMLADTMLPEAFGREDPMTGIVIALGFILGFGLSLL